MQIDKGDALRVLIVDDEVDAAHALAGELTADGFGCEVATDGRAALALIEKDHFDVVVSDVRMRGMGGVELLDRIRRSSRPVPVILLSAVGGTTAATALEHGAARFLSKPCDLEELRLVLREEIGGDVRRLARSEASPPAVVRTVGPAMERLIGTLGRAARATSPVLVRGESGSGKEVIARALHAMGPRRDRPFVATNVSAVPSELLESELFGHARGAFTGALIARRGLLTEADGGTLLLDEIGDMRLDLQAKLLRVLQNGEVRAVGADRARHVDVRFIAATHRDLPRMVRDGTFRHDLFFRLNVVGVSVPPLRERREDIVPLALHFLAASRARVPDSPVSSIAPDAMTALCEAPWPGNVRELESAMERLVVMGESEIATRDDIRRAVESVEIEPRDAEDATVAAPNGKLQSLDRMIRDHVATVMKSTGGNRARAAKILGVNLSTLYRWRKSESA